VILDDHVPASIRAIAHHAIASTTQSWANLWLLGEDVLSGTDDGEIPVVRVAWIVTYSRNTLRRRRAGRSAPPLNFRSWVFPTDAGVGENLARFAQSCAAFHARVMMQARAIAILHAGADVGVGAEIDLDPKLGAVLDDRGE